jgi:hypothetical protein
VEENGAKTAIPLQDIVWRQETTAKNGSRNDKKGADPKVGP